MAESGYRESYTVDDDGTMGDHSEDALIDHVVADADEAAQFPCTPIGVAGSIRYFFTGLLSAFTPRFVTWSGLNYGLCKGMAYLGVVYVQLPYFKGLGVDGSTYQKLYNVSQMAYALKPAIGVLSDAIPIMGYHKRYYVIIASVLASVALVFVNLLPQQESSSTPAAALLFIFMGAIATLDLLGEGKYSELMARDRTGFGSNIVTWVWMCYMSGGLIVAALEGTMAEALGARAVIWVVAPMTLSVLAPTLFGWLPEMKVARPTTTVSGKEKPKFVIATAALQHKGTIALGMLASAVALILAIISLLTSRTFILVGLIIMSVATLGSSFAVLPLIIAKANLFMYLRELTYLQINGPLDYFYTADEQCLPDGPHFSYSYYQTVGNIVGNISGFIGTLIFQRFLLKGTFRRVYWLTTFLKIFASFFDIIIVKRWNVDVGIPDKATYLFGDAIVYQVTTMLDFMPSVVLMSRLCPKGMEATIYALLAGVSNLGQVSSRTLGFMISEWLEIRTVVPCDFSNLPALIVITHMLLPLLTLPLTILLLPSTKMTEAIENIEDRAPSGPPPKPPSAVADTEDALLDAEKRQRQSAASRMSQYAVFSAGDGSTKAPAGGGSPRASSAAAGRAALSAEAGDAGDHDVAAAGPPAGGERDGFDASPPAAASGPATTPPQPRSRGSSGEARPTPPRRRRAQSVSEAGGAEEDEASSRVDEM